MSKWEKNQTVTITLILGHNVAFDFEFGDGSSEDIRKKKLSAGQIDNKRKIEYHEKTKNKDRSEKNSSTLVELQTCRDSFNCEPHTEK